MWRKNKMNMKLISLSDQCRQFYWLVRQSFRATRVAVLSFVLVIAPVIGAEARSNSHHSIGAHGMVETDIRDSYRLDGDTTALSDEHQEPSHNGVAGSGFERLCCEEIGLCSVGFIIPQLNDVSSADSRMIQNRPTNSAALLQTSGRPDAPPPRSQS